MCPGWKISPKPQAPARSADRQTGCGNLQADKWGRATYRPPVAVGNIRGDWYKKCVVNKRTGNRQGANILLNFGLVGEVWDPLLASCDFLYIFQTAESDVLDACFNGRIRLLFTEFRLVRRSGGTMIGVTRNTPCEPRKASTKSFCATPQPLP